MNGIAKTCLTVLLVQGCMPQGFAQQAPPNSREAKRSLIVSVTNSYGSPIRDLTKENFSLFLNGKPAVVNNVRYSVASHRIVVLLDLSGSMRGATDGDKWRIAVEAVRDLLSQAEISVPIAMMTFASEIHETFDFRQGRTAILNWLRENADRPPKLQKHKTALFDAIGGALNLLGNAQPGDAIYAITDGGENASGFSAHKIEEDLLQSGVRLFALLFVGPVLPQESNGEDAFSQMIQDSGGQAFVLSGRRIPGVPWDAQYSYDRVNQENVKTYTADLNVQINGFWTLDLAGPISLGKSKVKLIVTDRKGQEVKKVIVAYPHILALN